MSAKYLKMKVGDLQQMCKKVGTKSSGTKDELLLRLNLYDKCQDLGLKAWDGRNPATLTTPSHMNIANAKLGLSTMLDTWDLLLQQLVTHLEENAAPSDKPDAAISSDKSGSGSDNAVKIAKRVLELDETDDYCAILNLATIPGTPPITPTSSTGAMRKNYLKLSLLIHPDKLSRTFSDATKAFQALVRALERLSSPSYAAELAPQTGRGSKEKQATIARSNDGCHRTRVCCPRCKEAWSEGGLDGNPPYFFNFMMMGLKQFTCSTCLFYFGCMTAIHKCPHCNAGFEYSPQDYHRKLTCTREKCKKPFGFFMFPTSDRVLTELKTEVRLEIEAQQKAREAKIRRAARAGERGTAAPLSRKEEIKAFLMGLSDACPLCGLELETMEDDAQRDHLRECRGDQAAHARHAKAKEEKKALADKKEAKKALQESVQSEAAFQFLGAKPEQLWLMDDQALKRQAKIQDIDADGSRDELIGRLAASSYGSSSSSTGKRALAITDGEGQGRVKLAQRRLTADSLPKNYQSMSLAQLRSVLAAHGRSIPDDATKSDVLDMIDSELYEEQPSNTVYMIEE